MHNMPPITVFLFEKHMLQNIKYCMILILLKTENPNPQTYIHIFISIASCIYIYPLYLFPVATVTNYHKLSVAQTVKRLPTMQETRGQSLGQEDLLEKEMATRSIILAWKIPRMEEPGGLQSKGSQRVEHD